MDLLLNIGVFFIIFIGTSQLLQNSIAAAGEPKSFFKFFDENNYKNKIIFYLKSSFYIIDFVDGVKFVSRVLLSRYDVINITHLNESFQFSKRCFTVNSGAVPRSNINFGSTGRKSGKKSIFRQLDSG